MPGRKRKYADLRRAGNKPGQAAANAMPPSEDMYKILQIFLKI